MVTLLKNVTNSIWHAFHALTSDNSEIVYKSKLKVLTANIGTLLDLYGVEKGLDHYRSTPELDFEHFRHYLESEVFCGMQSGLTLRELQELETRIEEVCWLVCRKNYLNRDASHFTDKSVYYLFRIFCFLGDLVPVSPSDSSFQVLMHTSEVGRLAGELAVSLGLDWDAEDFESLSAVTNSFRLPLFLAFLEGRLGRAVAPEPLQEALAEAHDTLINDVIKTGTLLKRGYLLPTLREFWFVLHTTELSYYKSRPSETSPRTCTPCGAIPLGPHSRVDAPPSSGKDKVHRIVVYTMERSFELAAVDHRSRLQWISAIQLAINNSGGREGFQRLQAARRRRQRDAGTLRVRQETLRRTSQSLEIQNTREKLKLEIEAREAADQKAKELQDCVEKHETQAKELLNVRHRLERLLEEETQAKRDEEIVRSLQARVLREEWERREELEKLQEDQRKLLGEEREKRRQFERLQAEKETQLKEAEERLLALEAERESLDKELNMARQKIHTSERSKEKLEAQLRVISPQVRESDRVRRALSFMASTKDRPLLEIRPRLSHDTHS